MQLDSLLSPRSIAILGASERPSIGRALMQSLERLGFDGAVYPINPKYPSVLGWPCYPRIEDVPEAPDVVAFCVGFPTVLEELRRLPERGARAAVVYSGGFAEHGVEGRRAQEEIAGICRDAGIALCGPNCMGILNPHARATTYMQEVWNPVGLAGNVGIVSQSGSVCIGLLADVRRFGFSAVISAGNEAVTNTADYLEYLIDDPETKVIATFTETVHDPERYVAALDRAADRGKPVVVLKAGKSKRARRAVTSHTGGLAGESRVFSAVLRAHRAIEVEDMDELVEVLAVCQGNRWPRGRRIAVMTLSGGQAGLILDLATEAKLELPPLPTSERTEAEAVIGPITGDGNPLDAWGNGDYQRNIPHALTVLGRSAHNDVVVLCRDNNDDQPMGPPERALHYSQLLAEASCKSDKPHYLMTTRAGVFCREEVRLLGEVGVPVIGGTRQGLGAVDRMARWAMPLPAPRPERPLTGMRVRDLLRSAENRRTINEFDAKRLLATHGVPVARERLAGNLDEARQAAQQIGFPVVLKAVSDDIPHKSDHGLVVLGVENATDLAAAWEQLQAKVETLSPPVQPAGFLIQEMVSGGVEVFAGITRDPDFGPCIAFGAGGVAIELESDFALRPLPLRAGDAEGMIREIRRAALLKATRDGTPTDIDSLVECLYAVADYAWDDRESIGEMDLNPIKVLPNRDGCLVVDALIVPLKPTTGETSWRKNSYFTRPRTEWG